MINFYSMQKENKKLIEYQDAVWSYMLEHCDIQKSGALFVKFHTKSRSAFNGHINARIAGYHRGDPEERGREAETVSIQHIGKKKSKNEKWKADKNERFKIMQKVAIENKIRDYRFGVKQIMRIYLRWNYTNTKKRSSN